MFDGGKHCFRFCNDGINSSDVRRIAPVALFHRGADDKLRFSRDDITMIMVKGFGQRGIVIPHGKAFSFTGKKAVPSRAG